MLQLDAQNSVLFLPEKIIFLCGPGFVSKVTALHLDTVSTVRGSGWVR